MHSRRPAWILTWFYHGLPGSHLLQILQTFLHDSYLTRCWKRMLRFLKRKSNVSSLTAWTLWAKRARHNRYGWGPWRKRRWDVPHLSRKKSEHLSFSEAVRFCVLQTCQFCFSVMCSFSGCLVLCFEVFWFVLSLRVNLVRGLMPSVWYALMWDMWNDGFSLEK